jgi:hypothetical protein
MVGTPFTMVVEPVKMARESYAASFQTAIGSCGKEREEEKE